MGNAQSDQGEQDGFAIISLIPVIGFLYSIPRAIVYAAKGDIAETIKTGVGIPGTLIAAGAFFVTGPGGAAALASQRIAVGVATAGAVFAAAAGKGSEIVRRHQNSGDDSK
jgi:hypothetical protein